MIKDDYIPAWDRKSRLVHDLGNEISVYLLPLQHKEGKVMTAIAVFKGKYLKSCYCNASYSIDNFIYRMAMSDARRYLRNETKTV